LKEIDSEEYDEDSEEPSESKILFINIHLVDPNYKDVNDDEEELKKYLIFRDQLDK
jgi:hypothetical protein